MGADSYRRIYDVVRRIPRGRVTTYGTVARLAGMPGQARLVGYALAALDASTPLPWHRVVNAMGRVSLGDGNGGRTTQCLRLAKEGVRVSGNGTLSLAEYGWRVVVPERSRR